MSKLTLEEQETIMIAQAAAFIGDGRLAHIKMFKKLLAIITRLRG